MRTFIKSSCLLLVLVLTGCVTLYKPNSIHSPLLNEKGQFNTSAAIGLSGSGLYNLQAAYAADDHLGLIIDGMYHKRYDHGNDTAIEKLNMLFGEAGAGYFKLLGDQKNKLFQCYGGIGFGHTTDRIDKTAHPAPEARAKYINLFIQPGFSFINNNINLAFDLRTNYVHVFDVHAYMYKEFEWWNTDFNYYSDTSFNFINLEPTFTLKAGGEKLKGVLQFGLTIPVIHPESYFAVNTSSFFTYLINFSVGINYSFGKKRPEKIMR